MAAPAGITREETVSLGKRGDQGLLRIWPQPVMRALAIYLRYIYTLVCPSMPVVTQVGMANYINVGPQNVAHVSPTKSRRNNMVSEMLYSTAVFAAAPIHNMNQTATGDLIHVASTVGSFSAH